MYKCQLCNSQIGPHNRQYRIVVEKREKEYHNGDDGERVSQGWEIVRELVVCSDCTAKRL